MFDRVLNRSRTFVAKVLSEAVAQRCSVKKVFLKNFTRFTRKQLCWRLFILKKTASQVFSCEFYDIFKNTFFNRTPPVAASVFSRYS